MRAHIFGFGIEYICIVNALKNKRRNDDNSRETTDGKGEDERNKNIKKYWYKIKK